MKKNTILVIIVTIIFAGFFLFLSDGSNTSTNVNNKMKNMSSETKNTSTVLSENIGKIAPDFTLTKQDGSTFTLSEYKGKTVVLFFNEGSMCYPACWNQIIALGKDPRFNNENIVTLSIVIDKKSQWDTILNKQPDFKDSIIVFDTNKEVSRSYGALNANSSMHKGKLPGHTYFVINPEGKITYVLDDPTMGINNDALFLKLN